MIGTSMRIHFVGIGGIGMSGIAHILAHKGHIVSGCDSNIHQKSIAHLTSLGCSVFEGNNAEQCKTGTYDLFIYSSDTYNAAEIISAQQRGIMTTHRSVMLAQLMKKAFSIAVTGSHGKTTTTSLISHLLLENGDDPTFLIGGHLSNSGMNARYGNGPCLVAEADESDRSLLNLFPSLAVITTLSPEHLTTYDNMHDIIHTMQLFIDRLPFYGAAIVGVDNTYIKTLLPQKKHVIITFGFDESADWRATDVILGTHSSTFTLWAKGICHGQVTIPLAGTYNILNVLAACAAAAHVGMPVENIKQHLATFKGVDRRFSFHGTYKGAAVYDDYGHHPVEIKNALTVARHKAAHTLTVVFQPHRYTRTASLWDEFVTLLADAPIDHLIITDIYSAGEPALPDISGQQLVHAIKERNPAQNVFYVPFDYEYLQLKKSIDQWDNTSDVLLFQGAGALHILAQRIVTS